MLKKLIVLIPLVLSACSSTPPVKGYEKDATLETLNDSSQPDWADESHPFVLRSGKFYSLGVTTLRGDERPEAGIRIAENNARANIAKTIENRLEFFFQNAEENAGMDSQTSHYIGSEASTLTSHSIRPESNWYARFARSEEDGSRHIYYRIYSLISIPEEDLKKAIDAAINHKVEEHKLSETFQGQVNRQFERIIGDKPPEKVVAVKSEQESE